MITVFIILTRDEVLSYLALLKQKNIHPGFKLNGYIFVTIALREAVFRHAQVPFAAFGLLAFLFD